VGFNSLTTSTHPQNVNVPSSGKQVTTRLSARKVSIAGGTGPKTPWSGTLQNTHTHTHTHTHKYKRTLLFVHKLKLSKFVATCKLNILNVTGLWYISSVIHVMENETASCQETRKYYMEHAH